MRKRWLGWVIALVVLIVVLIAGFFVADAFARQYAAGYVRDRIIEVMHLDPETPVDVDLGRGSILLQAVRGSVDDVTIDITEVAFGEISGSARITATGVPLDGTEPVETLSIEVTVPEQSVRNLAGFLSGIKLDSIELEDGLIKAGTEFSLLFITVPVAMGLEVSAVEGGISFEPKTITLGDNEISVQDLRDNPLFSALAGDLLSSRDFCVATYLPSALAIEAVDVTGSTLVVTINGDGVALADPNLSTVGTCPGS